MSALTRRHRSRGQSLVEFALIIPLILLIVFGILDLGRGVFAYNTLAESARQANRLAIVDQDIARVKAEAVAFAPAIGLSASDVTVCFKTSTTTLRNCSNPSADSCGSSPAIGCLAIVTSSTNFSPITPLLSSILPSVPLSSTSIGPIEYVCPTSTNSSCP